MAGIFISYRRDDSQGFAGRLADDLTDILGAELVFRDVEIPVGQDFTEVLHRAVASCDVLIVVIGRNWQTSSVNGSQSRLFDPIDWVRAEIEAAFQQEKKVIPVLVGGAKMCLATDLPESIAHLSNLQAFVMNDRHWDADIQRLVQLLQKEVPRLKTGSMPDQQTPVESPAMVLRELGERVLDEVARRHDATAEPRPNKRYQQPGFYTGIFKFAQKTLMTILVIGAVYIGLRLFGDAEVLQTLDQIEARLQTGWSRLLSYLQSRS